MLGDKLKYKYIHVGELQGATRYSVMGSSSSDSGIQMDKLLRSPATYGATGPINTSGILGTLLSDEPATTREREREPPLQVIQDDQKYNT